MSKLKKSVSKSNIQKVHAPMIIYENVIDKFSEQHEIFDIQWFFTDVYYTLIWAGINREYH